MCLQMSPNGQTTQLRTNRTFHLPTSPTPEMSDLYLFVPYVLFPNRHRRQIVTIATPKVSDITAQTGQITHHQRSTYAKLEVQPNSRRHRVERVATARNVRFVWFRTFSTEYTDKSHRHPSMGRMQPDQSGRLTSVDTSETFGGILHPYCYLTNDT